MTGQLQEFLTKLVDQLSLSMTGQMQIVVDYQATYNFIANN